MFEGVTEFVRYLPNVFSGYNIVILLIGTLGGLILGALPGVSPTMAVALLVPFTFQMDASSGLILLGAVYTSSIAGGAISGILLNIPGAPANIATLLDGYPMAKSGRAYECLITSFTSSLIGGVFGVIVMIILTLPMSEFALKFGPSENFWLAVMGMTAIGTLSGGGIVKSLIAGAFGIWLGTIGPNPITGEFRFVFHNALAGGINFVPAIIGLFAIPQIFTLVQTYRLKAEIVEYRTEKGILWKTMMKTVRMFKIQGIGSVVGTVVGIIPGIGGQIAGLIAYDQAKKVSKKPESFGTGVPEGVAAAESANNAMVAPSLIPLLTLSIPGSPTAAVLLGGLLIHGMIPGPDLFRNFGPVVHTFTASLFVAQILMFGFGIMLARYSHWVMRVPNLTMAAAITILAVFGTYSVQNNMHDVMVMFILGIIMYVGGKFGFSSAPVVLGLILGPMAENNYLMGRLIAGAGAGQLDYFFSGWINVSIILLCVFSLIFGIYTERKMKNKRGRQ
jgi:putative tricarboxylic transport membrane protein